MGNWTIRWNFDKESYAPGESALIDLWFENTGDTCLYISHVLVEFDFKKYSLQTISGRVPPRANKFLGSVNLPLPQNIVGRKTFRLKYRLYEYVNDWVDHGFSQSDKQYFISIYPRPFYTVFVSRGLRIEDRTAGNPIVQMVKEWGFKTVTVGIETKVPEGQVPLQVREEISRADAVLVIATPRYLDALTGLWRTLEWVHDEVGIAFGIGKPLLVLKDRSVSIGGLPSYLGELKQAPFVEFDPSNLDELRIVLSAVMPGFREWIENGRKQEFFDGLKRIVVGGLAFVGGIVIISGIIGALTGTSKK